MRGTGGSGRDEAAIVIRTLSRSELTRLLGPAEAQYGQQSITLELVGAQGAIPCGTTVADQDPNDLDPTPRTVGVQFEWNDIQGETGYRVQGDLASTTFVTEDVGVEVAGINQANGYNATSAELAVNQSAALRVFGHVGHAPGHGATPIAGDVVSNSCAATLTMPAKVP